MIPDANTLVVTTANPDPTALTHWERSQKIIKEVMHTVIEALPENTVKNKVQLIFDMVKKFVSTIWVVEPAPKV